MRLRADLDSPHFPRRVLVVEPSRSECSRLCSILAAGEMETFPAGDLVTAVHAVETFQPDLILSQLRLPTHSGLALVRRVKEQDATRLVPVILYGDLTTAEERTTALDLGALDLITEPFVTAELLARVRAALKLRRTFSILEQQSQRDHLTGLANRTVLDDHLARAWNAYQNRGVALAVIIADLDHFKSINDTYGHSTGDEVLRVAARLLVGSVRSSDLVARYGGEELVVVASDCSPQIGLALAERFRTRLAEHRIFSGEKEIAVTASAGVAVADRAEQSGPGDLVRHADEALYRAKRSGRNAVRIHNSLEFQEKQTETARNGL
jgi:two-component system cell cycle response regulator